MTIVNDAPVGEAASAVNQAEAVGDALQTSAEPGQATAAAGAELAPQTAEAAGDSQAADYTDFAVPDGLMVNPELLGEFKTTLAGFKLSQADAQKVADLGVKQAQSLLAQAAQQQNAQQAALAEAFNVGDGAVKSADFVQPEFIKAQAEKWAAAIKADKELGGDKLAANLAVAARAVDAFGTPALKEFFNKSGLGNHPELIRAFNKAGSLISEDSLVPGGGKPAGEGVGRTAHERHASVLYGGS